MALHYDFVKVFNGMVGRDFIIAFNENINLLDTELWDIVNTLKYKTKSEDVKEFKVENNIVYYTVEEQDPEAEEDTREWLPIDITKWGNIGGNLEEQTDLMNILNTKAGKEVVTEMGGVVAELQTQYDDMSSTVSRLSRDNNTNIQDIADLKRIANTSVQSEDIKAVKIENGKFYWSNADQSEWYTFTEKQTVTWKNIIGDINDNEALMDVLGDMEDRLTQMGSDISALSTSFTSLENLVNSLNTSVGSLSDSFDNLRDSVTEDIGLVNQSMSTLNTTVDNHINDSSNPHSVTKAQVGLGNVDNTSDSNKPVSDPQRAYIADEIARAISGGSADDFVKSYGRTIGSIAVVQELQTIDEKGILVLRLDSSYMLSDIKFVSYLTNDFSLSVNGTEVTPDDSGVDEDNSYYKVYKNVNGAYTGSITYNSETYTRTFPFVPNKNIKFVLDELISESESD